MNFDGVCRNEMCSLCGWSWMTAVSGVVVIIIIIIIVTSEYVRHPLAFGWVSFVDMCVFVSLPQRFALIVEHYDLQTSNWKKL